MKRIYIGIAVAAGLMLSACEAIESPVVQGSVIGEVTAQDPSAGGEESFIFTAAIGADTKTYLDYDSSYGIYKLRWSEGDQILLWDADKMDPDEQGRYEFCSILNGAGTSVAEFVGKMEADRYVAVYAYNDYYPIDGLPSIGLPDYQYYPDGGNIQNYVYPMIAVSDTRSFEFQNIGSILKISITGNGELLDRIIVSSGNGEPVCGQAVVGFDEAYEPYLEFLEGQCGSEIEYSCGQYLSDTPLECYVVVPAQVYEGGIDITFVTDHGYMDVSTADGIRTRRSQIHDIPDVEFVVERGFAEQVTGEYYATGNSYFNDYSEWIANFYADEYDPNLIWIDNPMNIGGYTIYAYVDSNLNIVIPMGQTMETEDYHLLLMSFNYDGNLFDSGNVILTHNGDGSYAADLGLALAVFSLETGEHKGSYDVFYPGTMTYTRQQTTQTESFNGTTEDFD
jgi:hypothetical protein